MATVDPIATKRAWEAAAAAVLRRAGRLGDAAPDGEAWRALTRTTVEGIPIPPLGMPTATANQPGAAGSGTRVSRRTGGFEHGWDIRSALIEPDPALAAPSAVADLENGVTSLWWTVGGNSTAVGDLADALDGVYLDAAPIILQPAGDVTELAAGTALAGVLDGAGVRPAPGTSLGADPIGRALREGRSAGPDTPAALPRIHALASELGVHGFVVDGTAAHLTGAGDAAELGYSLAVAAAYLRAGRGRRHRSGLLPDGSGVSICSNRRPVRHYREVSGGPDGLVSGLRHGRCRN